MSNYRWKGYNVPGYWKWGLGDDGLIYWQDGREGKYWKNIADMGWIGKWLTIQRLKTIIDRFENLLPFL